MNVQNKTYKSEPVQRNTPAYIRICWNWRHVNDHKPVQKGRNQISFNKRPAGLVAWFQWGQNKSLCFWTWRVLLRIEMGIFASLKWIHMKANGDTKLGRWDLGTLRNADCLTWVQNWVSQSEFPIFYCTSPLASAVSNARMRIMKTKWKGSTSPELNWRKFSTVKWRKAHSRLQVL
jgi:hypothetical protein